MFIKRLLDVFLSTFGLLFLSIPLLILMFLVWKQDGHSPFYIAPRVGKNKKLFNMIKLRSMIVDADKSGVDSTSNNDNRITKVGAFIRRFKFDELMQLWNVLTGDMSLVGPRPNVISDTNLYTDKEVILLSVKPGITDFSSIIFSDEGEILEGRSDPDLTYNQLIRPWKSRLGLTYIKNRSNMLDIFLIFYTVIAIISKKRALKWIESYLVKIEANPKLIKICRRESDLYAFPPPGSDMIVQSR
tara:strand:- start:2283 stop:3014 length:732 start_codon:yes stop_codon:yes gene_type:complete